MALGIVNGLILLRFLRMEVLTVGRVFILGAGFSKGAAKIPLAEVLFKHVDDYSLKNALAYWEESKAYLMDLATANDADIDIEDRLSLLDALIDLYQQFNGEIPDRASRCRQTLIEATNQFLSQFFLRPSSQSLRNFVDGLEPTDVVITFNWDSVLEATLHNSNKPFSLRPDSTRVTKVLKLHGSIDWVNLRHEISPKHLELFEEIVPGLMRARSYDYPDGPRAAASPFVALDESFFIIPPTFYKKEAIAQLTSLWKAAYWALRIASEIIIIGYSLPKADYHAKALFRSAIEYKARNHEQFKITVINPDVNLKNYFEQVLHNQIDYRAQTFGEWLCDD